MRACASTYVVFGVMFGAPLALTAAAMLTNYRSSLWQLAAAVAGFGALLFAWIGTFKIVLTGEGIAYRSLFGGTRTLKFTQIRAADIRVGHARFADRFAGKPLIRYDIDSSDGTTISINIRVFSKADVGRLIRTIDDVVKGA